MADTFSRSHLQPVLDTTYSPQTPYLTSHTHTMASTSPNQGLSELEPPATDLITLTRHILSQQFTLGESATGDLTMLLIAIQVRDRPFLCPSRVLSLLSVFSWNNSSNCNWSANCLLELVHPSRTHTTSDPILTFTQVTSKYIASNVRKARLINLVGLAGAENVQGEDQKKLDVLSNDIMVNALRASGKVSVMVSEEIEEAIVVKGAKGT
jgi:hypothetical protein